MVMTASLYQKKTWYSQLKEQLAVLTLVKPALDALRVAHADRKKTTRHQKNEFVEARFERSATIIIEMITESIPSTIIQLLAFVNSETFNFASILAVISSISTAAFIPAVIM